MGDAKDVTRPVRVVAAKRRIAVAAKRRIAKIGRVLLAVAGVALVSYLVRQAGPHRVSQVLWQARSWLPLIVFLEIIEVANDFVSLRLLLGKRWMDVPASTWMRSSAVAYALMILVPAGRAAGEVTRATLLSRHIGAARAATASTQLQAAYVFAIAVVSAIECIVVASWLGVRSPLALLLAANALFMGALAVGLIAILWGARAGRWLERMQQRLTRSREHPPLDAATRQRVPWKAAILCCLSRSAQVAQYGIILRAVGGATGVRRAMVAHAIHLTAVTVGDVFPNGLGVVDGAYKAFAPAIGFGDAPERALSIALVAHATQMIVATVCLVLLVLVPGDAPRSTSSPLVPSARGEHTH
jgi:hypothetical protein